MVKGTGQPRQDSHKTLHELQQMREAFHDEDQRQLGAHVDSLIKIAVDKGDVRAHKLLLDRPRESAAPSTNPFVQRFLESLATASYTAE